MLESELVALLKKNHIQYNLEQLKLVEDYMNYVLKMNESINLTAIKEDESFRELMTYDSLVPLKYCDLNNKKIIDVGTGAGYPGVVLSIFTNSEVTLLDSTAKKINVIKGFEGIKVNTVVARCEDYDKTHREEYDIVTARAVSALNILVELCLPLVKVGGHLLAYKGKNAEEEIKDAKNGIAKLGGEVEFVSNDTLPNGEERHIIFIKKKKETNKKYPREYSEIVAKSL